MNRSLHNSALFLVLLAIAVMLTGALITSSAVAARQPNSTFSPVVDATLHRALAVALAVLTAGFAVWISSVPAAGWLRAAAWLGVATLAGDAAVGWRAPSVSPTAAVVHALLAHGFISLIVVIAVGTSGLWNRAPELVDGSSKAFLRPLAIATPAMVLLQIALGTAYRHDMTSILPHLTIAMGVTFLALIECSVVLQNFPRPADLRRGAAQLISIVLTQVSLGIASFLLLALKSAGTVYFVAATVGHVLVGASTLAVSVVLAMHIWRSVQPKRG